MARVRAASLRAAWVTLLRGDSVTCPLCDRSFRAFRTFRGRPNAECPWCGSLERNRQLLLYLRDRATVTSTTRVLHFSPERPVRAWLSDRTDYTSSGLNSGMVPADIRALPFDDEAFDLVICSHVLEHVLEDLQAINELYRVTRTGGTTLVLVPVTVETTLEDPTVVTPEDRLRVFGQSDHVRRCGNDYWERLATAGFEVTALPVEAFDKDRYGLSGSPLYVCTKH